MDWEAHCSAELFDLLIDIIEEATKRPASSSSPALRGNAAARDDQIEAAKLVAARERTADSFVGHIFYGYNKSSRVCDICGTVETDFSVFAALQLELPPRGCFNLSTCPQLVGTKETVHYVECTKCGYRTDRTKFDRIAVAPRVLQLQIKRVTTDPSGLRQFKSDTPVDFPLVLHVSESLLDGKSRPPAAYDLHAVSLHLGQPGKSTAHFVTLVRRGSLWYVVNDAEHELLSADKATRLGKGDQEVAGLTYVRSTPDGAF